jgi:hypothetical protein
VSGGHESRLTSSHDACVVTRIYVLANRGGPIIRLRHPSVISAALTLLIFAKVSIFITALPWEMWAAWGAITLIGLRQAFTSDVVPAAESD